MANIACIAVPLPFRLPPVVKPRRPEEKGLHFQLTQFTVFDSCHRAARQSAGDRRNPNVHLDGRMGIPSSALILAAMAAARRSVRCAC
jgi:hypothetical protein